MKEHRQMIDDKTDSEIDIERSHAEEASGRQHHEHALASILGPAFVAAVAYVDPGNVAANITSGARYGYLLVWVLVLANAMSVLIQYQSAKLGIVTGKSLPELLGERMGNAGRFMFFMQAEVIAIATDLAEVIGGAIALNLLFGLPLFVGGLVIGAASTVMLWFQGGRTQTTFERIIIVMLLVITFGFIAGLFVAPPDPAAVVRGLIPRFQGTDSVLMAASILGATVMPHAIYLHSTLVNDHYYTHSDKPSIAMQLKGSKIDVTWALLLAGTVNLAMLVLAANSLHGMSGTDSIDGAQRAITQVLGPVIGTIFSIGLLASSLSSTSVGTYAGSEIMRGLLHVNVPMWACRVVTLVPALIVLWFAKPHSGAGHRPGGAVHRHSVRRDSADALYAHQGAYGRMGRRDGQTRDLHDRGGVDRGAERVADRAYDFRACVTWTTDAETRRFPVDSAPRCGIRDGI